MQKVISLFGLLLLLTIATSSLAVSPNHFSKKNDAAIAHDFLPNSLFVSPGGHGHGHGNGNGNCGNGENMQLVRAILTYCADYWSVTYGYLRSEYAQGDLTITPVLYSTGAPAFDVESATKGIVCVLESNL